MSTLTGLWCQKCFGILKQKELVKLVNRREHIKMYVLTFVEVDALDPHNDGDFIGV